MLIRTIILQMNKIIIIRMIGTDQADQVKLESNCDWKNCTNFYS